MRYHRLAKFIDAIADRGRDLLHGRGLAPRGVPIAELCRALLSGRGEASGRAISREALTAYGCMNAQERLEFFEMLARDFEPDPEAIRAAADNYFHGRSQDALLRLEAVAEPPRQELFRRMNMAPRGTAALVTMRAELLELLPRHPELKTVDADLKHLLGSWFNPGFLQLERIDWRSPADLLEKIGRYETVQAVRGWEDLRRRLARDRRCFAFFHPALPDEPLIFVEVALVRGLATEAEPLLDLAARELDPRDADTAMFISINSTQRGLRGLSFGNFLIKQVLEELETELPALKTFATLSPMPGFAAALQAAARDTHRDFTRERLGALLADRRKELERATGSADPVVAFFELLGRPDPSERELLGGLLERLVLAYLAMVPRERNGYDPVARFHLSNGARLERINPFADLSPARLRTSHGVMVNYLYDPDEVVANHESFVAGGPIPMSRALRRLEKKIRPRWEAGVRSRMNGSFFDILRARFPRDPDALLIETPQGRRYSYGDLEHETARYARFLTDLGLRKGDRVAAQVEKSPEALFLYLACVRAGLIYLPLNTAYRSAEIDYFLEDAKPAAVVCTPGAAASIRALAEARAISHVYALDADGSGSLTEASRGAPAEFVTVDTAGDDVAAILYTSGTTGQPKGAMITHRNLAANALALHAAWGFGPGDVLLHALPLYHIHGLFVACHTSLLNGSPMIFLPKFDVAAVRRELPRATVFMGVPTYYTRLLAEPAFGRAECRNMRLFTCGSAPLLPQTFHEFRERTGHTILERYGMTETGMNTSNPLDGERRPGTVGPPLPGVGIRVVNERDEDLPPGETGQLLVKGENVFKGYWRLPEKTAAEFTADGWFRTGDVACLDADGYVSIVGRAKDLIISGGLNIYPKEIEGWLDQIESVQESAVIGVPHPDFGEAVVAVVVPRTGAAPIEAEIVRELKSRIAGFKVPKRVFVAPELPRNAMGKVQKNLLRERYCDLFAGDPPGPPTTAG